MTSGTISWMNTTIQIHWKETNGLNGDLARSKDANVRNTSARKIPYMSDELLNQIDAMIEMALDERISYSDLQLAIHDRYIDMDTKDADETEDP
jgi:hypothetical protein